MTTNRENHPVWAVYDMLRTTRLNIMYYGRRLQFFERWNLSMELILAFFAPTSAIAGLWFWNTANGKQIWLFCGILSAFVSTIKPIAGFSKRIKVYEGVLSGYRLQEHDLKALKHSIEQRQKFDSSHQSDFKRIFDREKPLISQNIESVPDERVRKECQNRVDQELPSSSFFIPED